MAKTIATVLGAAFILAGILGFISPGLFGLHLSLAHTIVHFASGGVALYYGLRGTMWAARTLCIIYGTLYGLLGLAGFIGGSQGTPTGDHPGPADPRLLKVIPGALELGTSDHILHILLGLIFVVAGLMTKVRRDRAGD
jgi:hypothetical protein